jgi:AcrR family transcriptional regulator
MAKRTKSGVNPAPEQAEARDPLDTALLMIGTGGWKSFSLPELARELDVQVADVYAQFPTRTAVLHALGKRLDKKMLDLAPSDLDDMSTRDRLFELMMRRFDAMKPYKELLRKVGREARGDLEAAVVGFGNLNRAVVEMVDAAGIHGPGTILARNAVGLLYLRVLRVWLRDDDPDQARTLSELDKGLARMEKTARTLCRFMPRRRAPEPASEAA